MKPRKIILIRHGESTGNANKEVYNTIPDYAVPLTPKGRMQASARGIELKKETGGMPMFFYVSPFRRTRETFTEIAKILGPENLGYREDPRIREQEWHTKINGFDLAQQDDRDKYGHFYYRFNGGESCADVYDRVSSFLDTMHRDFEKPNFPKYCGIISHGIAIRVFLMRWLHMTVEEFDLIRNPHNCQAITLVLQSDNRYKLEKPLDKYKAPLHPHQFPIVLD